MKYTHQCLAELLEYEHASLSLAQQCSGVAPQTPLFSSLLNYRYNGGSEQLSMDAIQLDIVFTEERTNYPVSVSVNDNPQQGFSLDIQMDASIGCERVGAMMLKALTELVIALEVEPSCPVWTLNVLPETEQSQVLHHFNQHPTYDAIAHYPPENCIHELFESQAKTRPEAIAIASEHQQLNYRERKH
ncbi:hypothetical protein P4S72_13035 [Vibrio sp. PP-XX7]